MRDWLREIFGDRPWWMNVLMVFSAYMTFVYMPWDIFLKPVAEDAEVWFGVLFSGWWAKLLALPHWFVYAAATYGFRRMRPWMRPWSAAYVAQIAIGMFVWNTLQLGGFLGLAMGVVVAIPFSFLALALWNARDAFEATRPALRNTCGEWALVTGASSGIGAEFARALAREGLSVVLVARRAEKLSALAEEIARDCGVETRVVAADLSGLEAADEVVAAVSDLEIGVLVNNAGVGLAGRFDKLDPEKLRDQVVLNCVAPTVLTRHLLPAMRERRCGAVIFTGSIAGRQPLPLHAVYAATKSFDLLLGEALWAECRQAGVDVIVIEPGSTETEFQAVAGEIPHPGESPADVVRLTLRALGGQPSVISGWFNWIRANFAARLAPRDMAVHIAHSVIRKQTPEEMR
ncbi:MAG: SDR family NAD(P)-dependent oxidoreductase [Myxococcota bacterium]